MRTLNGHLITIPNSTVANSPVENISERPFIKRMSNITITYDTPPDKVARAVEIIKDILDNHEGMNPEMKPKVYFNEFNDWSLNILLVAWYHPGDWWAYLDWCHRTNLEIMRRFEAEGIEFAFPTQTLYMKKEESG